MKIAFEIENCRRHGDVFYGPLLERLHGKYGSDFDVVECVSESDFERADQRFDLIIYKYRPDAAKATGRAKRMKTFLIDHGPLHCNRTPVGAAHFEVFSSRLLQRYYSCHGFKPLIKGYTTGFFLTEDLVSNGRQDDSCLVYMVHWNGERANSRAETPFNDEQNITYLNRLTDLFHTVHVSSHVDDLRGNFVSFERSRLLPNIAAIGNGEEFRNILCNVRAIFFEYSSVFALALWNPDVLLFQRIPSSPSGAVLPHAHLFHSIMDSVSYPVTETGLEEVSKQLQEDPLIDLRRLARGLIHEGSGSPCSLILDSIEDAFGLI